MPKNKALAIIPKKAIRLNHLAIRAGEQPPSSGHVVTKVNFIAESGLEGLGFLKLCDETYPPFLAKIVVGISQLYRCSLGKRASEERLVYDRHDNIVGTVSIALKKFVPMQSNNDSSSYDLEKNKLSDPETRTLIDENIAELLIASWRHREDDLHPGNLSIAGRLDYDMSWYHLTSKIKGKRIICGTLQSAPALATTLKEEDLHHFPILQSTRTHWPSQRPGNYNWNKVYKAQASFSALEGCDKFREQMFKSLLKELLSFQSQTIKARLVAQLGDEDINLKSLALDKKQQFVAMVNQGAIYQDLKSTKEHTFVDFFIKQSEVEFSSFYKCVVNYKAFRNYLVSHPESYTEVRDFFVEENKKYSQDEQFDLKLLEQTYQQIWRDTAVKKVIHSLKKITEQFNKIKLDISLDVFLTDTYQDLDSIAGELSDSDSDSDLEYLSHIPIINSQVLQLDNDTELKKVRNSIAKLHSNLSTYCGNYFEAEQASIEGNQLFIRNCTDALNRTKQDIDIILNSSGSLSNSKKSHNGSDKVIKNWQKMLCQLDYQSHLETREEAQNKPGIRYIAPQLLRSSQEDIQILSSDINKVLNDALVNWLSKQKLADVIVDINVSLNEYAPKVSTGLWSYVNLFAYTRKREPTVKKLLAKVIKETAMTSIDLVLQIFLEKGSGWNEQSLNSIIMKRLINKMLQDHSTDFDSGISYASLDKFKDAKIKDDFDFQQHILKVKNTFIDSIINCQTERSVSELVL